jgi:transposase
MRGARANQGGSSGAEPAVTTVSAADVDAVLERARPVVSDADFRFLSSSLKTLLVMTEALRAAGSQLKRLRKLFFGAKTERTDKVLGSTAANTKTDADAGAGDEAKDEAEESKKAPGHGRNGARAYTGAAHVSVKHTSMQRGDGCPCCIRGKVYPLPEPSPLVRVTGMAPISATIYDCEGLRCNLCGEVFTAPAPEDVGDEKYDESAVGMLGLLKYGTGFPFQRLETLQETLGIPMPASTQWDLVEGGAEELEPVYEELVRQAAQGEVVHNDDTHMKIVKLTPEQRAEILGEGTERTGTFTSGIVSTGGGKTISLFFTGVKHAGENLADVLAKRAAGLPKPIQMCDALAANTDGEFDTILAACDAHARRYFVDEAPHFPEECAEVLKAFRVVYRNEAEAKKRELDPVARLTFHQEQSGPEMKRLRRWCKRQLDEKRVEPNSGLGEALRYLLKHWHKLTIFLRVAGVPLDNNICERALKKAILHRKNALFYRTLHGAHVGDVWMSLIHTCELNSADPFDYLVTVMRFADQAKLAPKDWMPWNYTTARDALLRPPPAPALSQP